jgi:NADH-ubiquinone oxidoreductase chain 4L
MMGFILNRKNLLMLLISIELMLLAVTLIILMSSYAYNDASGHTFAVLIVAIAGAESAIGLGILVAHYSLSGSLSLDTCT